MENIRRFLVATGTFTKSPVCTVYFKTLFLFGLHSSFDSEPYSSYSLSSQQEARMRQDQE